MTQRPMPEPHPLFPLDDDAPVPDIVSITVRRFERGTWQTYPQRFTPQQLPDEQTVFDLWGGGRYTFMGYDDRTKIRAKASLDLAGESKPFAPVGEGPAFAAGPVAAPAVRTGGDWIQLLAVVAPLIGTFIGSRAQGEMKMFELMIAMMTNGQKDAAAQAQQHVATMQALHNSHAEAQTRLLTTLAQAGGGAAGAGSADFLKGAEFMKQIQEKIEAGGSSDEVEELVKMALPFLGQIFGANAGAGAAAAATVIGQNGAA